jgi:hypothetical protein
MNETGLPLALRLRRAALIALLLGLWAPVKILWELDIGRQQDAIRYHGFVLDRRLRDDLGQGLTIGVLSGMRSVVADLVWLQVTTAWEKEEWFRMGGLINLCTALQPRAPIFWDMGGWQLAWNASVAAMNDKNEPNDLRRIKNSRFWIEKGKDIYERGIQNNPQYWRLWNGMAMLYDQRLKDYRKAAYYYEQASQRPNAPAYLERAPAEMFDQYHANDDQAAYEEWKKLWERLTPAQRGQKEHWKEKIEDNIRRLEEKLSIPKQKRVFPN